MCQEILESVNSNAALIGVLGTLGGVWLGSLLSRNTAIEIEDSRQKSELKMKLIELAAAMRFKWKFTCGIQDTHKYREDDALLYGYIDAYDSRNKDKSLNDKKDAWKKLQDQTDKDTTAGTNKEADFHLNEHAEILTDILNILNQ